MRLLIVRDRSAIVVVVIAVLAALLGALLSGCDEDDVERMLGGQTAASIEHSYGVNRDPLLSGWLDDMGQGLVGFSTRQQIPYSFRILETDMVNAFAGPWGHVYVTEGLLDFAENEDQIAGVVGHEIGHVVNRDIMKSFKKSILFGIGVGMIGKQSQTMGDIAGIGLGLLSLRYSRKDEYGADDKGRELSYGGGYNPIGEVDFFQRLKEEKQRHSPSYIEVMLSSHPPTQRRIERQMQMPENDPRNADALTHIGQGYMRRAHYVTALKHFQRAAALAPAAPHIQVAMADALGACGVNEQAEETYQVVLASYQDNIYTQQRLAQVQARPPVVVAAISAEESAEAGEYTGELSLLAQRAGAAAVQAEGFTRTLGSRVKPMADSNSRMINELMALAEEHAELDEAIEDAVLEANAAIGKASEVIYALEAIGSQVVATASQVGGIAEQLEAKLDELAAGEGEAGQLAVVRRSAADIEAAIDDLRQTREQALDLAGTADQIQWLASDNLRGIKELLDRDEDEDCSMLAMSVRRLASSTLEQAEQAVAASRRSRQPVGRAQLRSLIVQANLAGMAAPATQRAALDQLVAYFMRSPAADIAGLRKGGMGFGDAACVMAIATSNQKDLSRLLPLPSATRSVVDQLSRFADSTRGARVMMKFLVSAMQEEVLLLSKMDV